MQLNLIGEPWSPQKTFLRKRQVDFCLRVSGFTDYAERKARSNGTGDQASASLTVFQLYSLG